RGPRSAWARVAAVLSSRWLRLCVGGGLLALLVSWVDLAQASGVVAGARLDYLALLPLVLLVDRLIAALRQYILLRGRHPAVTFWGMVRLIFVSGFAGYFMPGTVGVEAVRVYGLSRATANLALSVTAVLVERLTALLALCLLVLFGVAMRPPGLPEDFGRLAWIALAVLMAVWFSLLSPLLRRLSLLALSTNWLARVRRGLQEIYLVLDDYKRRPWLLLWSLAVALIFQLNRCLVVAMGAAALDFSLPFLYFVIIVPIAALISMMPISIAALGVREAAFVYLFNLVGMPPEVSFPLALLTRFAGLLMLLPGAWFYIRRGISA
ncbi:MAG: lysylphosphatidylglycerol synthase transmembrane domain-containing protein, partial [Geminicoccaceae bacterium]